MRSNERIKDAQRNVLECIRNFIKEHHYSPTINEICRLTGLRSKGTVAVHLRTLRDLGLVTWQPGQERTLVVTDRAWAALQIVQAYLEYRGVSPENRQARYRLRNVLQKPEVCEAIEELIASRKFGAKDAVDLHIAHIKGGLETVGFSPDGKHHATVRQPPSLPALMDYYKLVGAFSRRPEAEEPTADLSAIFDEPVPIVAQALQED